MWQDDIGDHHRRGVAARLYRCAETARDKQVGPSVSEASRLIEGPAFEVQVEMPAFNSGRAPWEIPGVILGYDREPRFDQTSPGALSTHGLG